MHASETITDKGRFDYSGNAELFSTKGAYHGRQPLGYKRFASAAEAIRFAIEDLPPQALLTASLEVDELRYASVEIRRLYDSSDYPLARKVAGRLA
jgi:hypothetical protein